jgi:amidohydrolase
MDKSLENILPSLLSTFKTLHAAPELSHYEKKTAEYMASQLKSFGYEVTENLGRYQNPQWNSYGVVAVLKNGSGPTILYRADMDALPIEEKTGLPYASQASMKGDAEEVVPVMHACGHDLHCTILLGVACLMKEKQQDWSGTLIFIAQPAEEVADAGAQAMLRAGLYELYPKPDFVLALHSEDKTVSGQISYAAGQAYADVTSVDIRVRGIGGHGASPHTCKDPVVLAAQIVLALQTIVSREIDPGEPAVITVGSIHGGQARNIIPEQVLLQVTIRSYSEQVRQQILLSIERICHNLARAAGLTEERLPEVKTIMITPAVKNHPGLIERLIVSCRKAIGEDLVKPARPIMGGEDFSWYALGGEIPAAIIWMGVVDPALFESHHRQGIPLPRLHSPFFWIQPEAAINNGVLAMTTAIIDLMNGNDSTE